MAIEAHDLIYFSGITLAILDAAGRTAFLDAMQTARANGKMVAFDSNLRPRLWDDTDTMLAVTMAGAQVADIVMPSFDDEATWFKDANPQATAQRYLDAGAQTVVVKNGPDAVYYSHDNSDMRETWRWFGEFDPIGLDQVAQTGAAGIVSALHAIPYGTVWPRAKIAERRDQITAAGFTWDVVESLPVHEDIKRGQGDLDALFDSYCQSLRNLAAEGIKTVCYNFMPILDWTRTDLAAPVARGGTCLHFSAAKMAAFEMHMLGRAGAQDDYHADAIKAGDAWFANSTADDQAALLHAIMSGLPGAYDRSAAHCVQR